MAARGRKREEACERWIDIVDGEILYGHDDDVVVDVIMDGDVHPWHHADGWQQQNRNRNGTTHDNMVRNFEGITIMSYTISLVQGAD